MEHDHGHADHSELSETERRVRALETVLTEKGYIDPAALDLLIDTFTRRKSARAMAHVWSRALGQTVLTTAIGYDAMPPAPLRELG